MTSGILPSLQGLDAHLVVDRPDGFRLDLAMRIPPGSTAVLLGPNGAGKSTAASALGGLVALSAGYVILNGRVLEDATSREFVSSEARNVGIVFQDYLLFPHMSAGENIAFGLRSRGYEKRDANRRARQWLEKIGLGAMADRRAAELSGGQAQRVALARALAIEPDLLVLDEPLAALDVTTRAETRRALSAYLAAFSGPRLVITHDPAEAFLLGDVVFVLENGSLSQSGSPEDIRRRPRTRYTADLVGINLVSGTAADGLVTTPSGHVIHIADHEISGPVVATFHPRVVSLHTDPPSGSPRNVWKSQVVAIEPSAERTRVVLDQPLDLTAEVTVAAIADLGIRPGDQVWVAIKATEIEVAPG